MLKNALASVAAIVMAAPALAGGLAPAPPPPQIIPVAPAPQPSADWTGFYVGLHAGAGDFESTGPSGTGGITALPPPGTTTTFDGSYYGAHIGYMRDLGRIVVGGELRYTDMSNISSSTTPPVSLDSMISGQLRLGYDMGRVLPYLAVGGAQLTAGGTDDTGLLYGGGIEFAASDHWILGVEANHYEFKDFSAPGIDITGNLIGLRASFRF